MPNRTVAASLFVLSTFAVGCAAETADEPTDVTSSALVDVTNGPQRDRGERLVNGLGPMDDRFDWYRATAGELLEDVPIQPLRITDDVPSEKLVGEADVDGPARSRAP